MLPVMCAGMGPAFSASPSHPVSIQIIRNERSGSMTLFMRRATQSPPWEPAALTKAVKWR